MIDHKAYEARLLAVELPTVEEQKAHEARVRRRKQGRDTIADALAAEAWRRAAERPTLDGIVAEAEKELGKLLPRGYRRPAIDSREDALYAFRLACHVAGHTYFSDEHPWNRTALIDAIRAAETRKLRPFIRRIAHFAFGPTMRGLCMPPGTFRLEKKMLNEDTDTVPKSGLAAAVSRAVAFPADDDAHPLGKLDALRRLFDGQTPTLQADVIDFVRLAYGSVPTWMTVRPAKPRGGRRARAGRPVGARQRVKRSAEQDEVERVRVERTPDEKRRRRVEYWNRWKSDHVMKNGGVLERNEHEVPPAGGEPEDLLAILAALEPVDAGAATDELDAEWNRSAAQACAHAQTHGDGLTMNNVGDEAADGTT
ncbi:hypothetical protein B0G76_0242 [Paraburkholderia sp. BL23I1N1]|uniref:hypothetical protein n=1 Tax=Paraburkholderia sp. BL23I1N1 TaxID=1938802 RepID=UPI000E75814E|nr:hypothetical protein [Paraburkholderia sp. BL23I1N1]RKE34246.1 hypothetical protein B0G76_0242 [Paraburkholderia sp. BL23I1N1]